MNYVYLIKGKINKDQKGPEVHIAWENIKWIFMQKPKKSIQFIQNFVEFIGKGYTGRVHLNIMRTCIS